MTSQNNVVTPILDELNKPLAQLSGIVIVMTNVTDLSELKRLQNS